jgi:Flp pilus assembly pilin Flp
MLFEPEEKGQALVDYSLIILLIAIVIIIALSFF